MKTAPKRYQDGGGVKKKPENAKKVESVPQGYNEYGEFEGKKYYTKESDLQRARQTSSQGGTQYNEFLQNQLKSGITPEELRDKGYISGAQIETFRPYYVPSKSAVYTEKMTKAPPIPLKTDKIIDRKDVTVGTMPYKSYSYPDVNAGYSKATTRSFYGDTPREIDAAKSYSTGAFVPSYVYPEGDERGTPEYGTVRNRSLSSGSMVGDETIPEKINKDKEAQKTYSGGFAKGGTVYKMKKCPMKKGGKIC